MRQAAPLVYRIAQPFARRKIQELAFDLRTHEGRVFEYAVLRFYVDRLEFWGAVLARVRQSRSHRICFSSCLPSRRDLIRDYKRHVVDRLDKIAKRA